MSNLRIMGLVVGVLGLLSTFLVYRGANWKRANFVVFSFFNVGLILLSIDPNVVNFARDLLSMQEYQYGRLIAIMIFSILFLMFFSFYTKSKTETMRIQFDRLVRNLGVKTIENESAIAERMKPIMVLIPAYDEAENLRHLLPRMPRQVGGMEVGVLVVDDGSSDGTADVVREHGFLVVSNVINRGGGAALRLGYDVLSKSGVKICVTMDADGQHKVEEIERLTGPIINGKCDFTIGSRVLGTREKDNVFRFVGVFVFGRLVSLLLGIKFTDPSSGFRAFRMDVMKTIHLSEDQYHTSELIIEAVKKGIRIQEVPITILKRKFGTSKKGCDWMYGLHFAKTIVKTWWR